MDFFAHGQKNKKEKSIYLIKLKIKSNYINMKNYRIYKPNTKQYDLYEECHKNQTVNFVKSKIKQYSLLNNCKMTMNRALELINEFIDPSDPDLNLPNSIHVYQTAERIRKDYPNDKEFQICGLIHDLGKILFKFGEPSWAVVGDTFPVGCEYAKSIVYYDTLKQNSDYNHHIYKTKYGIYRKNCGIENLKMSFGHDEYLYMVLKGNNNHKLSDKYINIIRFHSFYPWHTGNDYNHFMNEKDKELLQNVLSFNKYDLYSKGDSTIISDEIKRYYNNLLNDFFPDTLNW